MDGFEGIYAAPVKKKGGLAKFHRQLRHRFLQKFGVEYPGDIKMVMSVLGSLRAEGATDVELGEIIDWFVGGLSRPLSTIYPLIQCYPEFQRWRASHADLISQYLFDYRCHRSNYRGEYQGAHSANL